MSARHILALEIVALTSTATNAILIALLHRLTTSEFRDEYFAFPEFWGIVVTLLCAVTMVFSPVMAETFHLDHIVRMNFILLAFFVPSMGVFPLSYGDWYRYMALLAFLMTLTTPIWELVYRRIDNIINS